MALTNIPLKSSAPINADEAPDVLDALDVVADYVVLLQDLIASPDGLQSRSRSAAERLCVAVHSEIKAIGATLEAASESGHIKG